MTPRHILALVAVALPVAAALDAIAPEQSYIDSLPAPVYATQPVVTGVPHTTPAPVPAPTTPASVVDGDAATATRVAERKASLPLGDPPTPEPVNGICESWAPLLERYGIPYDEAHPIMWRESNCSHAHNGNSGTGDDSFGPLQVNRYGTLAAWWDSGGYTRDVMATPEGAIAAAAVLYHSCGWGPWHRSKGYPCYGDYLAVPEPRWGEW